MLSVATLKSASQASMYYEKGDYYAEGGQENNSQWLGEGAKKLGLEGAVQQEDFKKLLSGELPDGTVMQKGYNKDGEEVHRPGYDLTFSAPKSVSLLSVKDPRILESHKEAVKATLERIESQACARVKVEGAVEKHPTQNLVIATFVHNVSRALDPNLHSHCVVLNMTEIEEQWRNLYGDDFYTMKKSLGLQYRLELAQRLMKLGYELVQTSKEGFFEIQGIPFAVLREFSQRRQEIEQVLKSTGLAAQQKITMVLNKGTVFAKTITTVASSMANLVTRERKKSANIEDLKEQWDKELASVGFSAHALGNLVKAAQDRGAVQISSADEAIQQAIPVALEHLESKKNVFSKQDLLFTVQSLCVTRVPTVLMVEKAIIAQVDKKILIPLSDAKFTTAKSIEMEKSNIATMQSQQGKCGAFLSIGVEMAARILLKEPSKREALTTLLSSRDRFIAIDTQHENAQQQLIKAFSWSTPYTAKYMIGSTLSLAQGVAKNAGVSKAFTLSSFLSYTDGLISEKQGGKWLSTQYSHHVWFIHRSQTLCNKDLSRLQENAIHLNARVVFVGDRMRSGAARGGAPFRYLLENHIQQIPLGDTENDTLSLFRTQQGQEAIEKMEKAGDCIAIADRTQRMEEALRFVAARDGVLLCQNTSEAQSANRMMRVLKQQEGQLSGAPLTVQTLSPIALSRAQKSMIASYQVGDVLRFNLNIQNSHYKQGQYFSIIEIDSKKNALLLTDKDDKCYSLGVNSRTTPKFSLYRSQSRELQVGERLIWQDNTPKKLQNFPDFVGNTAKVVAIKGTEITLELPNTRSCCLDLSQLKNQHIEYAYARSLNSCSATDFRHGALLLSSTAYPKVNLSEVYTGLSAIKGERKIFCDHLEHFKKMLIPPELGEHAYIQPGSVLEINSKDELFPQAKGELAVTLLRHPELLAKINTATQLPESTALNFSKTPEYFEALHAVDFAIAKLSEREAVFSKKDLLDSAKKYDIRIAPDLIEEAMEQATQEGLILSKGTDLMVTKEVYAMECACLKIQKQGEGALNAILSASHPALEHIQNHECLTTSQKEAIVLALSSSDRVNCIQGVAGAGKTTMLKEIKTLAKDAGFELLGVANTASAKNNISDKTAGNIYDADDPRTFQDAGIPSKTLAGFLRQTEKILAANPQLATETYQKNTVFVLDEASLVSVRDMFAFLDIVEQLEGRTIIVGDNRQLPAIEASHPFPLLLGQSNSKVIMNMNTRLQTKAALEIMQDVYALRIEEAFDKLSDNLIEIPNREERLQAMANYYLSSIPEKRVDIMPMLPLNTDRVEFNHLIREGLKKEGTLSGIEIGAEILVAKDLTRPETQYAQSFEAGDWIKFNVGLNRLGINKGDLLSVEGLKDKTLVLRDRMGQLVHWDPARSPVNFKGGIKAYSKETRGIMAGDIIRWKENDEKRGMINSETAKVISAKEQFAEVELCNGKVLSLNLTKEQNQHWDHAYGATVHIVQGLDKPNPIGQGLGAAPYARDIDKVGIGSMIIIPATEEDPHSKVGRVINVLRQEDAIEVIAIDRNNQEHRISDGVIQVYPNFREAKTPKISSLESFLVMATRGDHLVMFVDNIDGYKTALNANQNLKKTALEIMLPKLGIKIQEKVQEMTSTVYGLANAEVPGDLEEFKGKTDLNRELPSKTATQNTSITKSSGSSRDRVLNKNQSRVSKSRYDVDQIKRGLESNILGYVSHWKGAATQKSGREARWGTKGSFSVVLSGSNMGTWADFEAGAAGRDLISLYMYAFNLDKADFPKVLEELARETGISPIHPSNRRVVVPDRKSNAKKEREEAQARAEYINKVEKFYASSRPIEKTLAEKYLREHRGIQAALPADFRFQARCWHKDLETYRPALIVPGYDREGKLQAVNRIYLNQDGSKLDEQFKNEDKDGELEPATNKKNYGPTFGATVVVNKQKNSEITYVSEGLEDALSIKQVQPDANILSSFGVGQLKNLSIAPGTKTIILCADNDEIGSNSKRPMLEAMQKWTEQGYQVRLAMPFSNALKTDFNDLLKHQGEQAIAKCLSNTTKITDLSEFKDTKSTMAQDFLRLQSGEHAKSEQAMETDDSPKTKNRAVENELCY